MRLPAVGTRLCAVQAVRLNERDLRPQQEAAGFVLELPRRAMVRVERYAAFDAEGIMGQGHGTDADRPNLTSTSSSRRDG